jgi:hypothetical protein
MRNKQINKNTNKINFFCRRSKQTRGERSRKTKKKILKIKPKNNTFLFKNKVQLNNPKKESVECTLKYHIIYGYKAKTKDANE